LSECRGNKSDHPTVNQVLDEESEKRGRWHDIAVKKSGECRWYDVAVKKRGERRWRDGRRK